MGQSPQHLAPEQFPKQISQSLRHSDVGSHGKMSHCGIARCFEDARIALIASAAGYSAVDDDLGGFLARIYMQEFTGAAYPADLLIATGIRWVGNTSYCSATALFSGDTLVAQGEAVNVCISDGRPVPVLDRHREALMQFALPESGYIKAAGNPPRVVAVPGADWHHIERFPRFSDTDALGHLNNVSVMRFYDDALADFMLQQFGAGLAYRVQTADLSYQAEARLEAKVGVATKVLEAAGDSIRLRQHLYQNDQCSGVHDIELAVQAA